MNFGLLKRIDAWGSTLATREPSVICGVRSQGNENTIRVADFPGTKARTAVLSATSGNVVYVVLDCPEVEKNYLPGAFANYHTSRRASYIVPSYFQYAPGVLQPGTDSAPGEVFPLDVIIEGTWQRAPLDPEIVKAIDSEEALEDDVVVRMPPLRKYAISLEISSVRSAVPKVVEP